MPFDNALDAIRGSWLGVTFMLFAIAPIVAYLTSTAARETIDAAFVELRDLVCRLPRDKSND